MFSKIVPNDITVSMKRVVKRVKPVDSEQNIVLFQAKKNQIYINYICVKMVRLKSGNDIIVNTEPLADCNRKVFILIKHRLRRLEEQHTDILHK